MFALFARRPDGVGDIFWEARIACAALISLRLYGQYRAVLKYTLPTRRRIRDRIELRYLVTLLVALVGPVSGWISSLWLALPTTGTILVPVVGTLFMHFFVGRRSVLLAESGAAGRWSGCLLTVLMAPFGLLAADGVLAFLVAGVAQPSSELMVAAFCTSFGALLGWAYEDRHEDGVFARLSDATTVGKLPRKDAVAALSFWLEDQVVLRAGRPDFALVYCLVAVGGMPFMFATDKGDFRVPLVRKMPLEEGERYLHLAETMLAMIDHLAAQEENFAYLSNERTLQFCRASFNLTSGIRAERLNRPEDAASAYRAASQAFTSAGMPEHAALAAIYVGSALLRGYDAPERAIESLQAIAHESHTGLMLRFALASADVGRLLRAGEPDPDLRQEVAHRQAAYPDVEDDIRTITAELPPGLYRFGGVVLAKALPQTVRQLEEVIVTGHTTTPGRGPGFNGLVKVARAHYATLERAQKAYDDRRPQEAGRLAVTALREAAESSDSQVLLSASFLLALLAVQDGRWTEAHDSLAMIIDFGELLREQSLNPERGSPREDIVQQAVTLLVLLLLGSGAGPDWPPPDAVPRALSYIERSRSRTLLSMLGETVRVPAPEGLDALAADEQRALVELRECRRHLVALDGTAVAALPAVTAARRAENRLRAIEQQIRETGPAGAEYLDVRRGTPIAFTEIQDLLRESAVS
ncbi:hypothetical protein MXD60_03180 [Frankia sp. AgB32]|nr:hypothetical protein [Frankia sp. AgB32]